MDVVTVERVVKGKYTEEDYQDRLRRGERCMLIVYDVWSGWLQAIDIRTSDTDNISMALRRFAGVPAGMLGSKISYMYSDGAKELVKACEDLGIVHDTSYPGHPASNAIAERQVQTALRGTRAALRAAGLPLAFWPHAMRTFCHLRNLQRRKDGSSPYARRFPHSRYRGLKLPFGAAVSYSAPDTTKEGQQSQKVAPTLTDGVLLGYDLRYGGAYAGGYVVIPHCVF